MIEPLRNFIRHTFVHLSYAMEDIHLSILDKNNRISQKQAAAGSLQNKFAAAMEPTQLNSKMKGGIINSDPDDGP